MKYIVGAIIAGLFIWAGFAAATPLVSSDAARRAIEDEGYTNITVGGVPLLSCGRDDSWFTSREFTATNAAGKTVSGYACCGQLFKGCTIRH